MGSAVPCSSCKVPKHKKIFINSPRGVKSDIKMEDDVSEKPVAGLSYYQVLTGLPPAPPKQTHQEKKVEQEQQKPSDDLPPSGFTPRNIQRNRNTLPKARQKMGPPPEEVYTSDNMSRTVSGENVNSQTYYNRGRGRGNYPHTRGSPNTHRGNSRDNSNYYSNSLPRSRGGSSRGRGQYDSYGSLPRRGGRQENAKGDTGYYRGNNSRGRGRGYYQGYVGSQGQINTQDQVTRAPSQRRIDSMQRKRKTKSVTEQGAPRSSSLPRNPVKRSLPDLMTNSFSSSNNIWSPDGKCPSFADILKRGSEEVLEQTETIENMMNTSERSTLEEEINLPNTMEDFYEDTKQQENRAITTEIITSTSYGIPEGFGSVPCFTQEIENEEINAIRICQTSSTISNNSLSLFSNNGEISVHDAAVLEPSITQTVQIETTENEKLITENTKTSGSETYSDELTFIERSNKPTSDDNISTSSQKTSRFGAIKSYANILSGGLRKVGNVFGMKNKDTPANKKEKVNTDIKTESLDSTKDFKENIEPIPTAVNQGSIEPIPEKPEIPGLLFKTDLERRPSRKKKRSRPSSTFEIEHKIEGTDNNSEVYEDPSHVSESTNQHMELSIEDKSVENQKDFEEIKLTENDKTNSMKRRNSKKKKKESIPTRKFDDEIDQALLEIKLMDSEEKNKTKENLNSLKRRPSKKSKKSSDN